MDLDNQELEYTRELNGVGKTKQYYMQEVLRLQNKINEALDLVDNNIKLMVDQETKRRILILDSVSIFRLVKILGEEDD